MLPMKKYISIWKFWLLNFNFFVIWGRSEFEPQTFNNIIENIDWSVCESNTSLICPETDPINQISGINMNSYFIKYVLPNKWNYQQYLCKDSRFVGCLGLSIGTSHQQFFVTLLKRKMSKQQQNFVKVLYLSYTIHNVHHQTKKTQRHFEYYVLEIMQAKDSNETE